MLVESSSKADSSLQAKQQLLAEGMYRIYHTRAPIMYAYAQLHMRILDSRDIASAER